MIRWKNTGTLLLLLLSPPSLYLLKVPKKSVLYNVHIHRCRATTFSTFPPMNAHTHIYIYYIYTNNHIRFVYCHRPLSVQIIKLCTMYIFWKFVDFIEISTWFGSSCLTGNCSVFECVRMALIRRRYSTTYFISTLPSIIFPCKC